MSLQAAERLFPVSPEAALALVAEAKESSSLALTELRDLVRGIYPPVLADRGLADAIRALALDTPLPVELDIDLPGPAAPSSQPAPPPQAAKSAPSSCRSPRPCTSRWPRRSPM